MTVYAITNQLTPVFDRSELPSSLDEQKLWRPLETLLFKGIPVIIQRMHGENVCEIQTPAYPSSTSLYTHIHFLLKQNSSPLEWKRPPLPSLSLFLFRITWCLKKGFPYLWGGNSPIGIEPLNTLYPQLDSSKKEFWKLKGLDCSGLIYWATDGATGRNSSDLICEGEGVEIEGLTLQEIETRLKPGMLIGWKGHVAVVTREGIVESTPSTGVHTTKIETLINTRTPLNQWPKEGVPLTPSFVVRQLNFNESSIA